MNKKGFTYEGSCSHCGYGTRAYETSREMTNDIKSHLAKYHNIKGRVSKYHGPDREKIRSGYGNNWF